MPFFAKYPARVWGGLLACALLMASLAACSGDDHRPSGALRMIQAPQPPTSGVYVTGQMVAHLGLPGTPRNFALFGSTLYVFMNQDGLAVVDISNPAAPRLAGFLAGPPPADSQHKQQKGGGLKGHYFFGGLAEPGRLLVADRWRGGLSVFETADPAHPRYLWTVPIPGASPTHILRAGDLYYISGGGAGVFCLPADFNAATAPQPVFTQYDTVKQTALYPPHWLLAADNNNGGLQVLDISEPRRPRPVHHFNTGSFCDMVEPLRGCAALGNRGLGIMVVDLTRPEEPFLASFLVGHSSAFPKCIARLGESRLLAGYSSGCFDVYDFADPHHPDWLARIPARAQVNCLLAQGDTVFAGLDAPPPVHPGRSDFQLSIFQLTQKQTKPTIP